MGGFQVLSEWGICEWVGSVFYGSLWEGGAVLQVGRAFWVFGGARGLVEVYLLFSHSYMHHRHRVGSCW